MVSFSISVLQVTLATNVVFKIEREMCSVWQYRYPYNKFLKLMHPFLAHVTSSKSWDVPVDKRHGIHSTMALVSSASWLSYIGLVHINNFLASHFTPTWAVIFWPFKCATALKRVAELLLALQLRFSTILLARNPRFLKHCLSRIGRFNSKFILFLLCL